MNEDDLEKWISSACEADAVEFEEFIDEATGPPLSKDEIKQARRDLAEWQTPSSFRNAVKSLHERCASKDYFNRPYLKFLHDAFVLAEFATQRCVDYVKLANPSDQWPDGYVRVGSKNHNVEVTGVHGGRKLGDDYKNLNAPELDPVENWVERGRQIPDALDSAIEAKVKKRYPGPVWLVVYLNIDEYGLLQAETERAIAEIKQRHASSFETIFVMWKDKVL